jgi:hypothetical protein
MCTPKPQFNHTTASFQWKQTASIWWQIWWQQEYDEPPLGPPVKYFQDLHDTLKILEQCVAGIVVKTECPHSFSSVLPPWSIYQMCGMYLIGGPLVGNSTFCGCIHGANDARSLPQLQNASQHHQHLSAHKNAHSWFQAQKPKKLVWRIKQNTKTVMLNEHSHTLS